MESSVSALIAALEGDDARCCIRSELADRFAMVRRVKGALAAYEATLVQATNRLDDRGLDGSGMLRTVSRMSSKAAASIAKTAEMLEDLPAASALLAQGRITPEHAATLATAASQTSPERVDAELVAGAEAAPADVFAKRSREWVNRNCPAEAVEDDLARRRAKRNAIELAEDDEMTAWRLELDPVNAAAVRARVEERCDELWRRDGGREGNPDDVRTRTQRMADAMVELLTQSTAASTHPRHQLLGVVDIDRLRADAPAGSAELSDGQPLPQWAVEHLACISSFALMVVDGAGQPLWMSRDTRAATVAQWKALIARDRGCVGCGAAPDRCEAHHIEAWRNGGPTDIDNLVLLCSRCHHDVHDRGVRLVVTDDGWALRRSQAELNPPDEFESVSPRLPLSA